MEPDRLREIVEYLYDARAERRAVLRVTAALCPGLGVADAYRVQQQLIGRYLQEGDRILGPKMGLTSRAKLEQMRVGDPIYGYVLESMRLANGGEISLRDYIHPKAEPEVALVLGRELRGPGVTQQQVIDAVESLVVAIEIIDSRYENFDFTLPDVIADNTSAAAAVYGAAVSRTAAPGDWAGLEAALSINGKVVSSGFGRDVLGNPAMAVACLANLLAANGGFVSAGQPILTGSMSAAAPLRAGDNVSVSIAGLGEAAFRVAAD